MSALRPIQFISRNIRLSVCTLLETPGDERIANIEKVEDVCFLEGLHNFLLFDLDLDLFSLCEPFYCA